MEQTNMNKAVAEFLAPYQKKLKLLNKSFGHESIILDAEDHQESLSSFKDSK
jgi:hypothetical protein